MLLELRLLQLHVLPVQMIHVVTRLRRAIVYGYRETRHVEFREMEAVGDPAPQEGGILRRSARCNLDRSRSGPSRIADRRSRTRPMKNGYRLFLLLLPLPLLFPLLLFLPFVEIFV